MYRIQLNRIKRILPYISVTMIGGILSQFLPFIFLYLVPKFEMEAVVVFLFLGLVCLPFFLLHSVFCLQRSVLVQGITKKALIRMTFEMLALLLCIKLLFPAINNKMFVYYVAVGVCEETLFRNFLLNSMRDEYGEKKATILSSIIFAFLLHLNNPFFSNLLLRFPLSLLLSLIRRKLGYAEACTFHSGYNMICVIIASVLTQT